MTGGGGGAKFAQKKHRGLQWGQYVGKVLFDRLNFCQNPVLYQLQITACSCVTRVCVRILCRNSLNFQMSQRVPESIIYLK